MGSQVFIKPSCFVHWDLGAVFKDLRIDIVLLQQWAGYNLFCRVSVDGEGALFRIKMHDTGSLWTLKLLKASGLKEDEKIEVLYHHSLLLSVWSFF